MYSCHIKGKDIRHKTNWFKTSIQIKLDLHITPHAQTTQHEKPAKNLLSIYFNILRAATHT